MKFRISCRYYIIIVATALAIGIAAGIFMSTYDCGDPGAGQPAGMDERNLKYPSEKSENLDAVNFANPSKMDAVAGHAQPLSENVALSIEAQQEEASGKIQDFEGEVLDRTNAYEIRLETPSLTCWAYDPGKADATLADALRDPGYVAFMAGPEAMGEGVYHTMADIARLYFEHFPDAQRVTVSLVIGGGVRDRETFMSDGDGSVYVAGLDY